jgi:hypothetical protein
LGDGDLLYHGLNVLDMMLDGNLRLGHRDGLDMLDVLDGKLRLNHLLNCNLWLMILELVELPGAGDLEALSAVGMSVCIVGRVDRVVSHRSSIKASP